MKPELELDSERGCTPRATVTVATVTVRVTSSSLLAMADISGLRVRLLSVSQGALLPTRILMLVS